MATALERAAVTRMERTARSVRNSPSVKTQRQGVFLRGAAFLTRCPAVAAPQQLCATGAVKGSAWLLGDVWSA